MSKEGEMKKRKMEKPVTSLRYDATNSVDKKLLSLVNNYSFLFPGIAAGSLIRNLLIEVLAERIERKRSEKRLAV